MTDSLWTVVLAGGDGTRLSPLTRALYGDDRPKQFAVLKGHRSLLQETVERAATLVPFDRIVVVVTGRHEALAREQLARYPGVELVIQPRNLDTGPGLLLPLAWIRARDPGARVAFLPSDHHVSNERPILAAITGSGQRATRHRITLLGVRPDHDEIEYGWITCGSSVVDRVTAYEVRRFIEKPDPTTASRLHEQGALWNTFISVGPVDTFWAAARAHLPEHAQMFEAYTRRIGTRDEGDALAVAYQALAPANFSRDVLARARGLVVMPVAGSGWCDWGSPSRVFRSLEGTPDHHALVARITDTRIALAS